MIVYILVAPTGEINTRKTVQTSSSMHDKITDDDVPDLGRIGKEKLLRSWFPKKGD